EGYTGKWYIIGTQEHKGKRLFLLEHQTYGDEAASLIVDQDLNIVLNDVGNGFDDLDLLELADE
ncbi:MAG TPA: antirestriction protein, partial [Bacillota bacterium]|nr:antirestriction protein [Bacillota bacterium]